MAITRGNAAGNAVVLANWMKRRHADGLRAYDRIGLARFQEGDYSEELLVAQGLTVTDDGDSKIVSYAPPPQTS